MSDTTIVNQDEIDVETAPQQPEFNITDYIAKYIKLRDKIAEIAKKHEAELAPYKEVQTQLGGLLLDFLNKNGVKSSRAKGVGTIMVNERKSATLNDVEAFRLFVVNMGEWDLADLRANAPAIQKFVDDNGTLPPGVNLSTFRTLGVRRASDK